MVSFIQKPQRCGFSFGRPMHRGAPFSEGNSTLQPTCAVEHGIGDRSALGIEQSMYFRSPIDAGDARVQRFGRSVVIFCPSHNTVRASFQGDRAGK